MDPIQQNELIGANLNLPQNIQNTRPYTREIRMVTGNMLSGASQHHKRRPTALRKTEAMIHAERQNGKILDEIWRQSAMEFFQIIPNSRKSTNVSTNRNNSLSDSTTARISKSSDDAIAESNNEWTRLLGVDQERKNVFVGNGMRSIPTTIDYINTVELLESNLDNNHFLPVASKWSLSTIRESPESTERSPFLRLNIGGTFYLLLVDAILCADQNSFLSKFVHLSHPAKIKVADGYLSNEDAYYFQRSPLAFEPIFQYYASGVIHKPADICASLLTTEMEFWRIPATFIGSCCSDEVIASEKQFDKDDEQVNDATFEKLMCGKLRRRMWTFLERPGSSIHAKVFELSSTLFVAISVMGLSFATIPEFQITEFIHINDTSLPLPNGAVISEDGRVEVRTEHPAFIFTERICIAFFTVEYALRYFAAPRKFKFMLKPLNLVDLLAVVPFYLELFLTLCGVDDKRLQDLRWAFLVVRILRVLRVIRIIKLGRFSSGLQTFGMTLKRSQKQLQMMTIVLLTGVVFFSTMIYFLEKDEEGTPFSSIPAAYWWCIVTMTTVGYGDVVPVTTMGKIIASAAIMSGVLVLALPITIIVDNFIKVAQDEQQAEQYREVEQRAHSDKKSFL